MGLGGVGVVCRVYKGLRIHTSKTLDIATAALDMKPWFGHSLAWRLEVIVKSSDLDIFSLERKGGQTVDMHFQAILCF